MQGIPNRTEVRVPTQTWAGYGFSQSSPSPILPSRTMAKQNAAVSELYSDDLSLFTLILWLKRELFVVERRRRCG